MASQTVTDRMSSIPTLDNVLSLVWAPKPTDSFWDTLSDDCKTSSVEMSAAERAIGSRTARKIAGKVEDYWQTQLLPAVNTVWCHHRAYIVKKIEQLHVVECLMMEVQPTTFKPTVVLTCGNRNLILRFQHKIKKDPTFKRSGFDITTHQGALVYAMMPDFDPDAGPPSGAPPEPAGSGSSRTGRGRSITSRDASPSRGPVHTRHRSRSFGGDDSPPQRPIIIGAESRRTDGPFGERLSGSRSRDADSQGRRRPPIGRLRDASPPRRRSPVRSRDDSIIILGPANPSHPPYTRRYSGPTYDFDVPNPEPIRTMRLPRSRRWYPPPRFPEPDQRYVGFFDSQPKHPRYTQRYSGTTYKSDDALDQGYIDSIPSRYIPKSSFEAENPSKSPSRSSPPRDPAVIAGSAKRDRLNMPEVSNSKPLPDPISSSEYCGAPMSFYVESGTGEGEIRWATMGGVLSILGRPYYLTTAHQFLLEPPANALNRDVMESDVEDSEYGSDSDTDNDSEPSTVPSASGAMTHDPIRDTLPSFVEPSSIFSDPYSAIHEISPVAWFRASTITGRSLIGMEEDWALLGIARGPRLGQNYVNRIRYHGKMLEITKINSVTKTTTALLIRTEGEHTQVMCSSAQALVSLPGSQRLHQVHRVDGPIRAGDSGSWVIDAETGDLLGIIATKCGDDAGYMLLAKNVVAQIQDKMGLELGDVGLPSGQAPSEESIQRAARFFDTRAPREPLLSEYEPKNPWKARASPITREERATDAETTAFLDEINQRLEALASHSTSTDVRDRVSKLRLDCDIRERRINSGAWSAGDSIAQLNRDRIKAAIESLEAMRIEE